MPTVSVKWQKETFPAVEVDTEQPPYVFKCQLYDLTGVPPDRQKIMIKGALLKDDGDWSTLGVKQGQKLMMMGTADEIPRAPEKSPVFVEDLPEEEQSVANLGYTAGLVNLGNTCYMNSTVQCLHSVPELKAALQKYSISGSFAGLNPQSHTLTLATRDLFNELDRSRRPVAPDRFLQALRSMAPQFAETSQGLYMQQDAEECWNHLVTGLNMALKDEADKRPSVPVVKQLFEIQFTNVWTCDESREESTESETVFTLKCHITQDVNHLHDGLKQGLISELEKTSPLLGRSAVFVKQQYISQLPPYLTVQFVRFFWKKNSKQKAKILRKVDYPLVLDVFDFCTDELKAKLKEPREALRRAEDVQAGLAARGSATETNQSSTVKGKETADAEPWGQATAPSSSGNFADGGSSRLTGIYDLVTVLTHKGRSIDSGHYVAWVKQENGKWIEYDDANPIPQRDEEITKLSGGGDWHMAYILMYKARVAPAGS